MRRIDVQERRARLGRRHHLAGSSAAVTPEDAAHGVVALHATDPASVFLSVRARTPGCTVESVESALYERRALVRMLGMRRTVFVVPVELAPVVQAAATAAVAVQQRRRYVQLLEAAGAGDAAWLAEVADATAAALDGRGEASAAQLSADEPRLRTRVVRNEGKAYGGAANVTSWVLLLLAAEGRIVRGRPLGSWTSTQYRWSPLQTWLPDGLAELDVDAARAELVRAWLASYGPGSIADLRWWTGWTAAIVNRAVRDVGAVAVEVEGGSALVLPEDLEPVEAPEPWVALLPALDPTPMGWTERSWYLGPHAPALFDRSGNVGPTVWCDGRVVGGWAQRGDGEVVHRLLEDVGAEASAAVAAEAADVQRWIGPVRVVPRFRTPLERELTT